MMHPHTRLAPISDDVGLGVVATHKIPAGTIVWVLDPLDHRIPRAQAEALGPLFGQAFRHYAFWEHGDDELVLCWDHGRYVNHACDANCLGGGFRFEIAVRDIEAGEELTDDYATFGYASELQCRCGSPLCRGTVAGRDAARLGPSWDARLASALTRLGSVAQPLWPLVVDKVQVEAALRDPAFLPKHRAA